CLFAARAGAGLCVVTSPSGGSMASNRTFSGAGGTLAPPSPLHSANVPLRVFLSSTSVDLEPDRTRVADLVAHLGHFAVEMGRFALRPHLDATALSLEELASSDLYLLLVAWRYGYVPPGADLSVTHEEYRAARRLGLPCFVFLADPATDADQH